MTVRDPSRHAAQPWTALLRLKPAGWAGLRGLGESALAKATMVMPVVGYLLILNRAFLHWLDPSLPATGTSAAPPLMYTAAWRLVFIYYGLTFTGVATAMYALLCPKMVKKYADAIDYALGQQELYGSVSKWNDLIGTLFEALPKRGFFLKCALPRHTREDLVLREEDVKALPMVASDATQRQSPNDSLLLAVLRAHYAVTECEHPFWRLLIFALYIAGLILVVLSSLWGILEVTATVLDFKLPSSPWLWFTRPSPGPAVT
jgi:hypothetical protein